MDASRFDALVRAFASGGTRRRLVAVLAALPLGGSLLPISEEAAAEHPRDWMKRRNKQHNRKRRNQRGRNKNQKKHQNMGRGKGGGKPGNCAPSGQACQQNSNCCGGNCFDQICANTVTQCGGVACPAGATGCCDDGCCSTPANQCNQEGLCCAPNCPGRECGPDGCGKAGTCGTCRSGQTCDTQTGQCLGAACSPASCPNGCCDEDGDCQPGDSRQACGDGGVSCTQCGPNQFCSTETGTCRDNPPCSPETCPNGCCDLQNGTHVCRTDRRGCGPGGPCCNGCCDNDQACLPGDDAGACGAGGSRCVACDPLGGQCDQGRCQCDANNCPHGCCDDGPGNPGLCFVDDPRFCASTGGSLCVACPSGTSCCPGNQTCGLLNGQHCSEDSQCCTGNCFDNVCADLVTRCGNQTCDPPAKGCGGNQCCFAPFDLGCAHGCCGDGFKCCNGFCCPVDHICCPNDSEDNALGCCAPGSTCCLNGMCCPSGVCCGEVSLCCPSGNCCGDTCCVDPTDFCCGGGCCPEGASCSFGACTG
jgi:hypothetical protein